MQRSPVLSLSAKRALRTEFEGASVTGEPSFKAPRLQTEPLSGSIQRLAGDPNIYKAIIVPIELVPVIEKLLNELLTKMEKDKQRVIEIEEDEEVLNPPSSFEEDKTSFINDFGSLRRQFDVTLKKVNEKTLIEDVPSEHFERFKSARKTLTRWYVTGAHLHNKIKGETQSNNYLKVNFDYSVAVTDTSLKQKCTTKLLSTKRALENSLTSSVLERAKKLNSEARTLLENDHVNITLKAYRVVLKANRNIFNSSHNEQRINNKNFNNNYKNYNTKRGPPNHKGRDPYRKYDWNNERNHFESYNYRKPYHSNNDGRKYDEDFPPPRRDSHNYRRYKRQLASEEEDDYQPPHFKHRPRSFYGHPSNNYY